MTIKGLRAGVLCHRKSRAARFFRTIFKFFTLRDQSRDQNKGTQSMCIKKTFLKKKELISDLKIYFFNRLSQSIKTLALDETQRTPRYGFFFCLPTTLRSYKAIPFTVLCAAFNVETTKIKSLILARQKTARRSGAGASASIVALASPPMNKSNAPNCE